MINKINLNNVPNKQGCYLWKDKNNNVIYIGKAKRLKNRMLQYFQKNVSSKTQILKNHIATFEYILTKNEMDALLLELNLITKYNPKYNVRLKENKKYPYINLRLKPKVKISLSKKYKKDGSLYFGPFPEGFSPSKVIKILKTIFPINECLNTEKNKACINYQLNLCMGECIGKFSNENNLKIFNEIKNFLEGNISDVIIAVTKKIEIFIEKNNFEEAKLLKNNLDILIKYKNQQHIFFKDNLNRDFISFYEKDGIISLSITYVRFGKVMDTQNKLIKSFNVNSLNSVEEYLYNYYQDNLVPNEIVTSFKTIIPEAFDISWSENPKSGLRKTILDLTQENSLEFLKTEGKIFDLEEEIIEKGTLELEKIFNISIKEIEMIDISNIGGKNQVAGVVNFLNGKPNKSKYRKYILNDKQDDYENIYKTTYRHFKNKLKNNIKLPDLYIVDGKHQLFFAEKALMKLNLIKNINIASLIKNEKHQTEFLFLINKRKLKVKNNIKEFLSTIQFEAHRFVINYHRQKRKLK